MKIRKILQFITKIGGSVFYSVYGLTKMALSNCARKTKCNVICHILRYQTSRKQLVYTTLRPNKVDIPMFNTCHRELHYQVFYLEIKKPTDRTPTPKIVIKHLNATSTQINFPMNKIP